MAQYFQQQVAEVDAILYKLRCYRDPQRIRTDVVELLRNIPSLQPRSGALARGANQSHILYLAGTIPIFYNGVQYNIPVNIWVIEAYPISPPVCYVTPVQGMVIKQKHKHVDSAGMCYLPYLSNWNANTCNLVGLIGTMCKVFGQDPPVRAVSSPPPSQPPVQPPQPNPVNYGQPPPNYTQPPQPSYPNNPQGGYPPSYGNQPFEDPAIVAKRNAVSNVTNKIQERLHQFNIATTKEMDELMIKNGEMESKMMAMSQDRSRIEEDKARMDADIEALTKNFEDLTRWLDSNDSSKMGVDIDAITEPKDPLSKQLLYLVAEEASIEDTLYYLEKKMIGGGLDTDTFLKNVRTLSTEQFIKRATIKKIHEKQRGV